MKEFIKNIISAHKLDQEMVEQISTILSAAAENSTGVLELQYYKNEFYLVDVGQCPAKIKFKLQVRKTESETDISYQICL